jgi:Fe-coproporphyrin III synthase
MTIEATVWTQRFIQLHPTRRCNLRCLHCYSSSGPEERDCLGVDVLQDLLTDASELGYNVASFSGGEPVLYKDLWRLLQHAKTLGQRTTVTSNGMLLDEKRLEPLRGRTDVLAISLDGVPRSHNRMRGSNEAFDRMLANLPMVRASEIPFGFIFTLTRYNVDEAHWAARFSVEQGAKLFQIHPLEESGRAGELLRGSSPDELESAFAFLVAEGIRQTYGAQLHVQLDVLHRDHVKQHPYRFYAGDGGVVDTPLAELVSPIVVEADGVVAPLGYGFGRSFVLGSLNESRLRDMAPQWIRSRYPAFRALCHETCVEACKASDLPFFNWHHLIGARSTTGPRAPLGEGAAESLRLHPGAPA